MRILLITPPMLQFNAPYPATPYLTGYLKQTGYTVTQWDASLDLALRLFSKDEFLRWSVLLEKAAKSKTSAHHVYTHRQIIAERIESIIRFLQGKEPALAYRINTYQFIPQGPRFAVLQTEGLVEDAFGSFTLQDKAKFLASLFIDDLADAIKEGVDSNFELAKYGEKLSSCQPSLDVLYNAVQSEATVIDTMLIEDLRTRLEKEIALNDSSSGPLVVGFTVPFPGNMYAAARMANFIRRQYPSVITILGGGYVNTELRKISEEKLFDWFHYITLDDGERPLVCVLEALKGERNPHALLRTYRRNETTTDTKVLRAIELVSADDVKDVRFSDTGTPSYEGLRLDAYISMTEMLNPVYRLWSDGRWNKMILAHGCYWAKCSFCDTSLDYIQRYEPDRIENVIQKMDTISKETGQNGFHFVDEAAPPALLKSMSQKLIQTGRTYTWWGNIRFEKMFESELTDLMAQAGCVAVTGGLEVASPRLLKLINKGVTLDQVARVTQAFRNSGIYVHAYLMYGFPTETTQETVDSLEVVRQLFAAGCLNSAFWHRFAATIHAPIGKNPEAFGITLQPQPTQFAENDVPFTDPTGTPHDALGEGLRFALYNYMHGRHLDAPVHEWFEMKVPRTKVARSLIESALR